MATEKKGAKGNMGKKIAIGAGLVAASAGAYYFMGPDGKKNQKKVKAFADKMKKEAEAKIESLKDVTESGYHNAVDFLAKKYSNEYKDHAEDIHNLAKTLKSNWKSAKKTSTAAAKKVKKAVKKTTHKK